MGQRKNPARILVADDDLGVIAAYRYVLEGDEYGATQKAEALAALGEELFGKSPDAPPRQSSWHVDFVDQGDDAVKAVQAAIDQSAPYSMIFLDIRMPPGLDGYETAEKIRAIDPLVYIVFVSAYSDYTREELKEVAGGEYRTGFLCKPVWPHQLMSTARAMCGEQTPQA